MLFTLVALQNALASGRYEKKILVPMDLSEDSLAGVGYALNLAKTHGGKVLQVVSYHEFLRSGEKLRERIINDPTWGQHGEELRAA